jgi:hypothetical protein
MEEYNGMMIGVAKVLILCPKAPVEITSMDQGFG